MNQDIRQDLANDIEAKIADLMAAHRGLSNTLLGQGFVVVSSYGSAMTYDVNAKGGVSNPRTCAAHLARRFGLDDARTVAVATHDGTEQPYRAVHVLEAIDIEMQSLQSVLETLQQIA
jgi:hypothetical protein